MTAAVFNRQVQVYISRHLTGPERSRVLARMARQGRDALIRDGRGSPSFLTAVDGRQGVAEEQVRPDGVIVYRFNHLATVITFALGFLVARSPELDGDYKRSWRVAVDGRWWGSDMDKIPPNAVITIVNTQPYHRKIDVGGQKVRVPPQIVEDARQTLIRRYGALIEVERQFITIPDGYVLKGRQPRRLAVQSTRSSAFRAGRRYLAGRRDTAAGQRMTYPALIIQNRR